MNIRPLSKELQKVAKEEINEDPSRIESDLNHLKEWLKKQPHLNPCYDDQFLVAFLRGTKFSLERAKEKLDMHYTLRTVTPELYTNRKPSSEVIRRVLDLGASVPLPKLPTESSPRYILIRQHIMEKYKLDPKDIFKVVTMIQDIQILEDDNVTISGIILLQDFSDITAGIIKLMSPGLMKKVSSCLQYSYPYRIRGILVFNIPKFIDIILNFFKPFMSEKMKKRMSIYSSQEELCKIVPLEILPEEYGGQGGKLDDIIKHWKNKVLSYEDWFIDNEKRKSDESKRIGEPKTEESVFGIQGSFRQLAVD